MTKGVPKKGIKLAEPNPTIYVFASTSELALRPISSSSEKHIRFSLTPQFSLCYDLGKNRQTKSL
jgi:hypothetical protein